ncbi:unnamed protein product [Symbiodinium pilosum]|uniref:EF-hand domain-containing protein n=1 Tax=Symbiodinium pilosum TaxID=2952 RepID=A0A812X5W4_SYMPI|nr:unnamed protein product [Symbiodinium pilosum]
MPLVRISAVSWTAQALGLGGRPFIHRHPSNFVWRHASSKKDDNGSVPVADQLEAARYRGKCSVEGLVLPIADAEVPEDDQTSSIDSRLSNRLQPKASSQRLMGSTDAAGMYVEIPSDRVEDKAKEYQVHENLDHLDAFQNVYRRLRRTGRDSGEKDVSDSLLKAMEYAKKKKDGKSCSTIDACLVGQAVVWLIGRGGTGSAQPPKCGLIQHANAEQSRRAVHMVKIATYRGHEDLEEEAPVKSANDAMKMLNQEQVTKGHVNMQTSGNASGQTPRQSLSGPGFQQISTDESAWQLQQVQQQEANDNQDRERTGTPRASVLAYDQEAAGERDVKQVCDGVKGKARIAVGDGKTAGEQKKMREKGPLPFKIISWSSQKRSYRCAAHNLEYHPERPDPQVQQLAELEAGGVGSIGNQWETDAPPEHFLFLDLGSDADISKVKIRCTGTLYDPKNITVMRAIIGVMEVVDEHHRLAEEAQRAPEASAVNSAALITRGTWAVIARASLKSGPQARDRHSHTLRFPPIRTRFLRIIFHASHSTSGNMRLLHPLIVYGKKLPLVTHRKLSATIMFDERFIDEMERATRKLARKYHIPIDCTETVLKEFSRWDTESRGFLNYTDFKNVVRSLTYRHLGQKEDVMLQDNHLRALWNIVDRDSSGCVDFEEFLQWFYSHFQKEKPPARSLHCSRMVDTVTEHFYASMGINRLRCYVTALDPPEGRSACKH